MGGSEHSLTNTLITASNNNVTYIRIAFILGDPGTVWSAPQRFFALSSSLRDETKNGCEASFQVSSLFNIYENYLQSNVTDLHVAKNNRGRSVSQVLNITNGKKMSLKKDKTKLTVFQKKSEKRISTKREKLEVYIFLSLAMILSLSL